MSKKSFLTFGLLAGLTGQALANGGTVVQQQPTGFYFGGAIGSDWARYKNNLTLNENATNKIIEENQPNLVFGLPHKPSPVFFENFNQTTPFNFKKSDSDVNGGAFIGYKTYLQPSFYLALEGFGDLSSNRKSWAVPFAAASFAEVTAFAFNNYIQVSTRFKGDAGVRLRAGVPINALNSFYFLTGFSEGFFKFRQNNLLMGRIPPIFSGEPSCGTYNPVNLFNFTSSLEKNISKPGFQLGGGWERIFNNFGVRVQYAANFYKNFTTNNLINLPPNIPFTLQSLNCAKAARLSFNDGTFSSQLREKPTIQQLTFGVFYQV
jgi:hypothetical protein